MTSWRLLIIFGACITFSPLVICDDLPTFVPGSDYEECRRNANVHEYAFNVCVDNQFSLEKAEEAARTFNGSKCPRCKYFCSKQAEIRSCINEFMDSLKSISTKAILHVVPFIGDISDRALSFLCDNDADMMTVYMDVNNAPCFSSSVSPCGNRNFTGAFANRYLYCDSANPENDPFTAEFVCRSIVDYLECMEENNTSCTPELPNFVSDVISKLKSTRPCDQYYPVDGRNEI